MSRPPEKNVEEEFKERLIASLHKVMTKTSAPEITATEDAKPTSADMGESDLANAMTGSVDSGAQQEAGGKKPADDEDAWLTFVAVNGSQWDGTEEGWEPFRQSFVSKAAQEGLRVRAAALLDDLATKSVRGRIEKFDEYGVTIMTARQRVAEQKRAQERMQEVGTQKETREKGYEEAEKQFFASHKDDDQAYAGFDEAKDDQARATLGEAKVSSELSDIMVMPGNTGMGAGNNAVTLVTPDKVTAFKQIVLVNYGPKPSGPPRCYRKLLERIQVGTILVSSAIVADDAYGKGTIWHEAGHKKFNQEAEAGEVFAFEIQMVRSQFDDQTAHDYAMESPRKPEYHRTYGLKKGPGKEDLLKQLQEICSETEFYNEFRADYEAITGNKLPVPQKPQSSSEKEEGGGS